MQRIILFCVSSLGKIRLPWWTPECSVVSRTKKAHLPPLVSVGPEWNELNINVPRLRLGISYVLRVVLLGDDMSPPSGWTSRRLLYGVGYERSRRYAGHPPLVLDVVVSYLTLLWRLVLLLVWSLPNTPMLHPIRSTLGPILYPLLMSGRFRSRIMFLSRCLSCISPLPAAGPDGLLYPFLLHLHPTAMEFLLSSSTGFTRLNFFLTYCTCQLSFTFQNQARITPCLGISVQSL